MRIHNKYLRNRHFRIKYWKTIRNRNHPYECHMPQTTYNPAYIAYGYPVEEQIANHLDWIGVQARALEKGGMNFHAPKTFRKYLNRERKSQVRAVMAKINLGDYDVELPKFKRDADWLYF